MPGGLPRCAWFAERQAGVASIGAAVTRLLDGIRWSAVTTGIVLALAGCARWVERAGVVARDEQVVATKLLRPQATARACASSLLGFPLGKEAGLDAAVSELLARDDEANVLTNVEVRRQTMVTGVYNRRCVEVRGDLGRIIPTVALPMPGGHESHR